MTDKAKKRWKVYYLGRRRRALGIVHADTESEAIEEAVREFNVPDHTRHRVVVERW